MGCLKLHTETTPITMKVVRKSSAVGPKSAQCFMSVNPLASKYPHVSPYNYCLGNPVKYIDPNGKEIIAPNEASRALVLESVSYMFGKDHGYSFDGNRLVHSGTMPSGLSSGQQTMFKYFNETLVNSKTTTTVMANSSMGVMESREGPQLFQVGSAAARTFGLESFVKYAGNGDLKIPVFFDPQNLMLITGDATNNGTNVMTNKGNVQMSLGGVASHEFGHAIVNAIMNEFGGVFNGVDFNKMTKEERADWSIRFTNTLGKIMETGEYQHSRGNTKPAGTLDPLQN